MNVDPKDVTVDVLAHEFSHAGARMTYYVEEKGLWVPQVGLLGAKPSCSLFEELAAMTYSMAGAFGNEIPVLQQGNLVFDLRKEMAPWIHALLPAMIEVADSQGMKAAQQHQGAVWVDAYIRAKSEEGDGKFRVPIQHYKGIDSAYMDVCACTDLLGLERLSIAPSTNGRALWPGAHAQDSILHFYSALYGQIHSSNHRVTTLRFHFNF